MVSFQIMIARLGTSLTAKGVGGTPLGPIQNNRAGLIRSYVALEIK
jgi:hypothetical protein